MEIKLENISGNNKSAKVGKINIKVGDKIEINTVLMQLETNKGNSPVKSGHTGEVKEIKVSEGDEVQLGDTLVVIDSKDESKESNSQGINFDYFGTMISGKKEEIDSDLTIIGAGPGGYVAAIYAAKQGLKTVIVEKEYFGGTCLNVGCIPTKALVKSSEVFSHMVNCEEFGLSCENPKVNMTNVIDRKDKIKDDLVSGIEYLLDKNNVKVIKGEGSFKDKNTVFAKSGKDEYTIHSKNIIIATGSKISKINIPGIDSPFVLNSTTALENKNLPESITIIGGGVIGMEFAFMYSNFGVNVNVVEYMPRVLTMVSKRISTKTTSIARQKGINIYTNSKVTKIEETEDKKALVIFENGNKEKYLTSENILVAIGREPNINGLNLDNIGIELNEKGRGIKVDDRLRSNIENIYAIGDVNNKIQLAHVASHQGIVAVDNILGKEKHMDYSAVPNVIFTSPEIATVGMDEKQAKDAGLNIKVSRFPLSANGKAKTMGEEEGFIEIIKDIDADKIIGASIIGADASTLISALTLIVQNNITEEQIVDTIFPHPTTGEIIHEAALGLGIGALHFYE